MPVTLVRSCFLLFGFLAAGVLGAAELPTKPNDQSDFFEHVLVPIFVTPEVRVPGGYGTSWGMELWVHNRSRHELTLQLPDLCAPPGCDSSVPPGFIGLVSDLVSGPGGALLHIGRAHASDVQFSARLFEYSRRSQPTGVEIPIVREAEFFSSRADLLGIPSGAGTRSSLRLYNLEPDPVELTVTYLGSDGTVIDSEILTVPSPGDSELPPAPGYLAIHDLTSRSVSFLDHERFHVLIESVNGAGWFWAMASVTDNESQHVILVTPQ